MKKIRACLTLISLTVLSSCIEEGATSGSENYVKVGGKVPDFEVSGPEGLHFSSAELTGRRSLIVLFSPTCSDCRRELPKIDSVWNKLDSDDSYRIVNISRALSFESDALWLQMGFSMPYYYDPDKTIFHLFANTYVPRIYFVNPQGVVTDMAIEKLPLNSDQIIEKLRNQ
jgi:peroxiredoxin